MHRKLFVVLVLSIIIFMPIVIHAQNPFGGMVNYTQGCNSGMLLYVQVPFKGVQRFMWFTGNLPYLMKKSPHVGQNLLGMSGFMTAPCYVGKEHVGDGLPILYHGSSI